MKNLLILLAVTLTFSLSSAQERSPLRGKVMYMNISVPDLNVINIDTETATTTDENGEFMIDAGVDDVLVFTSLNYEMQSIRITAEILEKNRMVVAVDEKVTELDEVVVTPENQEKFLELKGEEFKEVDYQTDASTRVENEALPQSVRGMEYGLNFVNIYKALFKSRTAEDPNKGLAVSEVLRQVYDDEFFVNDLKIPQDSINAFLYYVDSKTPPRTLLQKEQEFQLIDYLVNRSREFNELSKNDN